MASLAKSAEPWGNLGSNIHRRRVLRGLTLETLAAASGVSSTMLSEVERGRKNPTVKLAYQIGLALGCSLTDLLADEVRPAVSIVRANQRATLRDDSSGVVRHGVRTDVGEGIELAWYTLPAGTSTGEMQPNLAGVREHLIATRGRVEVVLGGEVHEIGPGDSIGYRPQTTCEYRNRSRGACEFVIVIGRG